MARSIDATSRLHHEEVQFKVILGAAYPFFLAATIAQRVMPAREPGRPAQRRSVFGEAKAMAVSAIPYAFMG